MDTANWKSQLAAYAKMKILIVDGDPANIALLEDMLGEQGYTQLKSRLIPAVSSNFATSSTQT